jgi:basic membrane protein A and related proteins
MPISLTPSRRQLLTGIGAGAVAASVPFGFGGPALAAGATIGAIYVGPRDDFGWNQAHAAGMKAIAKLPNITVLEAENIPETDDVAKQMDDMVAKGAQLIFATSFGYFDPFMLDAAKRHPNVQFRHCAGLWQKGVHPDNAGSYFGYIHENQFLSGIAAGYATKSNKIGFIGAKPIVQVNRNASAFLLGARSVNPKVELHMVYTGDWALHDKEVAAVDMLQSKGVDVITCHVDGPKQLAERCEQKGVFVCGYHVDQSPIAPTRYLTGAEWNWEKVYSTMALLTMTGKKAPNFTRGSLLEGITRMSAYSSAVGEEARKAIEDKKAKFIKGSEPIFIGPLKDNKGNSVINEGDVYQRTDERVETVNWLVEGTIEETL